jgi:hypothetical protein
VSGRRKFAKGQRKTISDVPGFNGTEPGAAPAHQLFVLATQCIYNSTRYRPLSIHAALGRPTSSHGHGNGKKRVCGNAYLQ